MIKFEEALNKCAKTAQILEKEDVTIIRVTVGIDHEFNVPTWEIQCMMDEWFHAWMQPYWHETKKMDTMDISYEEIGFTGGRVIALYSAGE